MNEQTIKLYEEATKFAYETVGKEHSDKSYFQEFDPTRPEDFSCRFDGFKIPRTLFEIVTRGSED
jgi:hypothetical protein